MWSRLIGGGDGLPSERVDAVVLVIDRYFSEEATLRGLQTEKQTIHPRDLPPDKRRALMDRCSPCSGRPGRGSLPSPRMSWGSKARSGRAGSGNS